MRGSSRLAPRRANTRAGTTRGLVAAMEGLAFDAHEDEYRPAFLF
jgi:hypothetical protein